MRKIIFSLLFFILLLSPVSAVEEIHKDHIKSFNLNAPEGLCLSGLTASDFTPDSNTSYSFNMYGKIYNLDVNSSKNWGWWNFDITLTYPNGTIETKQLESFQPFADNYDLHVQYYFLEWDTALDVDVYAGLLPLTASFTAQSSEGAEYAGLLPEDMTYNAIAFSNIAGSSNSFFDLVIYATTEKEFEDQKNQKIGGQINHAAGEVFSWTWDKVLSFVELIPGIGPYLASVLEIAALSVDAIIFYFSLLFIEYSETTFLSIEFFILSYSLTGFKRGGLWGFLKKLCKSHMALLEFCINAAEFCISVFSRIVSAVAAIVQSIKPL